VVVTKHLLITYGTLVKQTASSIFKEKEERNKDYALQRKE